MSFIMFRTSYGVHKMKKISKYTYLSFAIASILTFALLSAFPKFDTQELLKGIATGLSFFLVYYFLDRWLLKALSIKTIANIFLSLLLGIFFAEALKTFIEHLAPENENVLSPYFQAGIYLFTTFLTLITLLRTSGKTYIQLPFVKLSSLGSQEHSLILDQSALKDSRLIDLLESGIIKQHIFVPIFIQKNLQEQNSESSKKALQSIEKIQENHQNWGISFSEPDLSFSSDKCYNEKLRKAISLLQANLMTSDSDIEIFHLPPGRKVVSLQMLSTILKPVINSAEHLSIMVQRVGKEAGQGVGYLEDGTMVVINGGGEFVGEEVETRIISTKHSSTGRIIFCNLNKPTFSQGRKKSSESRVFAEV